MLDEDNVDEEAEAYRPKERSKAAEVITWDPSEGAASSGTGMSQWRQRVRQRQEALRGVTPSDRHVSEKQVDPAETERKQEAAEQRRAAELDRRRRRAAQHGVSPLPRADEGQSQPKVDEGDTPHARRPSPARKLPTPASERRPASQASSEGHMRTPMSQRGSTPRQTPRESGGRRTPGVAVKSNHLMIKNAVVHVCLAGVANAHKQKECLAALEERKGCNFVILFAGEHNMKFRGLYTLEQGADRSFQVEKVYGSGPATLNSEAIAVFYKYNSANKGFNPMTTKSLMLTVDAVALPPPKSSR